MLQGNAITGRPFGWPEKSVRIVEPRTPSFGEMAPQNILVMAHDLDFAVVKNTPFSANLYHNISMAFPIKVCAVCGDEFELKPGKPGFANRCPACSEPESAEPAAKRGMDADERKSQKEANEARRQAMRNLLYRKDN